LYKTADQDLPDLLLHTGGFADTFAWLRSERFGERSRDTARLAMGTVNFPRQSGSRPIWRNIVLLRLPKSPGRRPVAHDQLAGDDRVCLRLLFDVVAVLHLQCWGPPGKP